MLSKKNIEASGEANITYKYNKKDIDEPLD